MGRQGGGVEAVSTGMTVVMGRMAMANRLAEVVLSWDELLRMAVAIRVGHTQRMAIQAAIARGHWDLVGVGRVDVLHDLFLEVEVSELWPLLDHSQPFSLLPKAKQPIKSSD